MTAHVRRYLTVLELGADCTAADARAAYRRLAKRNHPDLFPDDQRSRQQLRMMRINEAYMAVLAAFADGGAPTVDAQERGAHEGGSVEPRPGTESACAPGATGTQVGSLRDPAYAYYKQGFRYFNLGATELSRKEAPQLRRALAEDGTADGYILRLALRALHYFERSYSYFLVVVDRHPTSPWAPDARWKLRRLEKFSSVYQRICENLSRRSSAARGEGPQD